MAAADWNPGILTEGRTYKWALLYRRSFKCKWETASEVIWTTGSFAKTNLCVRPASKPPKNCAGT